MVCNTFVTTVHIDSKVKKHFKFVFCPFSLANNFLLCRLSKFQSLFSVISWGLFFKFLSVVLVLGKYCLCALHVGEWQSRNVFLGTSDTISPICLLHVFCLTLRFVIISSIGCLSCVYWGFLNYSFHLVFFCVLLFFLFLFILSITEKYYAIAC